MNSRKVPVRELSQLAGPGFRLQIYQLAQKYGTSSMKPAGYMILILLAAAELAQGDTGFEPARQVIESRCLGCHDSDTSKGGIDLEQLLASRELKTEKVAALWQKVDRVVRAGEMPPKKKKPLSAGQKAQLGGWYRSVYVLKDGKEHIGRSVLRRLSRYELVNTLGDLLFVSLKQPYVFSPEFPAFLPSTLETILPPDAPGESGFYNDSEQLAGTRPPILKYSEAFDYALRIFAQDPEAREKVFGFKGASPDLDDAGAGKILQGFMKRAWRGYRNPQGEEVVLRAWRTAREKKAPVASLLHAMKTSLLSPAFLYRIETVKDKPVPYPVGAYELASRLSYFLWGSMPDDELFSLAADGRLLDEAVLLAQVDRMLKSPRRISLSEDFAGQWLGFGELWTNKVFYRNERWNRGIYDEVLFFFDELIKSDRSILEVVDSDWIYQSDYTGVRTAGKGHAFASKHGDIFGPRRQNPPGIQEQFYKPPRLISIKSDQRGGLITTVGILRVTSAPEKTNPIRRGVWLLDRIIGRPMHAPENVPALSKSEKVDGKKLTDLADILKAHTSKAACISCHKHIAPLGLGLENFAPFGKWRTAYRNRRPVRSKGVFPSGETFETPGRMKQVLLGEYRESIVTNIAGRMLAYALGRKLEPHDRPAVRRICDTLKQDGFKINTLISSIVRSRQFQCRQDQP